MDIFNYIVDNALILIPALIIIGMLIKQIELIPNKFIPLILLVCGIAGTFGLIGLSADSAIQGVLVTGAAVYGNQIYKQMNKEE